MCIFKFFIMLNQTFAILSDKNELKDPSINCRDIKQKIVYLIDKIVQTRKLRNM